MLYIDRSIPFDPVAFIGKGWSIVEQDERSLALTEVDINKVISERTLRPDEVVIKGEDKLKHLSSLLAKFVLMRWFYTFSGKTIR